MQIETRYLVKCIPFQIVIPVLKGDKENMKYKRRIKSCFKYVILIAAIVSICVGVGRNEPRVVLRKAANICFECIGIG